MPRLAITNLSKGEFGPELYGRVDIPQYNAGVKEAKNWLIQRYGGMAFRPGFRFAGEVDNADKSYRLTAFQYSIDQAYIQLHGDAQTRFLAEGGFVVEDDLKILSATIDDTVTLEVPFHGYTVGERVWIDGATGMVELNNRFATVVLVPDANHVTLNVDSRGFSVLTGSTGITRVAPPAPPPAPEPPPAVPPAAPAPPVTSTPTVDLGGSIGGSGPGNYNSRLGVQSSV
jgi:hypothetical protein